LPALLLRFGSPRSRRAPRPPLFPYATLFRSVRALHPKFKTPWVAILVFSAAAVVALLPGTATFLATLYAFGATLSFTIAHLAVIDRKSTRLNSSHVKISYAVFCLKKKIELTA